MLVIGGMCVGGWGAQEDRELDVDEECMLQQHGIKDTARYTVFAICYTNMAALDRYTLDCVRRLWREVLITLGN